MDNWNFIKAAVQGRGHVASGTPCQDKVCCMAENGCSVVALADGAGSARLSHHGAERAARSMCLHLCRHFDRMFLETDALAVKRRLTAKLTAQLSLLAMELGCRTADLASTLLVAAVKDGRYILIHLGDGVIAYRRNGELRTASRPHNGEFANCTFFTTSPKALSQMNILKGSLNGIDGFALMSDGSAAGLYSKRQDRPAAVLGKIMDYCTYYQSGPLEEWLQESLADGVRAATTDDCSLAVLAMENPAFRGMRELPLHTLCELTGIPPLHPSSRRRVNRLLAVHAALSRPLERRELARLSHTRLRHLHKPLHRLQEARFIRPLPNGRFVSATRGQALSAPGAAPTASGCRAPSLRRTV